MTTAYNHEAVELGLYIDNTNEVYQLRWAYFATLDKHWQRGRKRYHDEHGTPGDKWYRLFTPAIRREVAEALLDEYVDHCWSMY
jgi:hypothetical protein